MLTRIKFIDLGALCMLFFLIQSCKVSKSSPRFIQDKNASYTIIHDILLVGMQDSLTHKGMSVVIKEDRIEWVGETSNLPSIENAKLVEGQDRYLMPGLIDMHVHLRSELELLSYLYFGVTTIFQLSGPNAHLDLLDLRKRLKNGELMGPNLVMTGPMLDGSPAIWSEPVSLSVQDEIQARKVVEDQYNAGFDFIKIYNRLSKEAFNTTIQAANEKKMSVIGHIPRGPGASYVLQNGQKMVAHMEEFFFSYFDCIDCGKNKLPDRTLIPALTQMLLDHEVWVTPNLSFIAATRAQLDDLNSVLANSEFQYLSGRTQRSWMRFNPTTRSNLASFDDREKVKYDLCKELTLQFYQAGIPLLAGTDASVAGLYPGQSIHLELSELRAVGLSNYAALETATSNAGHFIYNFGLNQNLKFGKIQEGFRADLLLVGKNPLEDINFMDAIDQIICRGQLISRDNIQQKRLALMEE